MRSRLTLGIVAMTMACGSPAWRDETIVATDYAFRAPDSLPAGVTVFRFVNQGRVLHEVQLFRFNRGMTTTAANRWLATGTVPDSVADAAGSVLVAGAGQEAPQRIWTDLKSGELYALMCQFRDAAGKPQHASLGMVALLRVTP